MVRDIDRYNLRMKFSALNVNFSSLSPDSLSSRRPVQAGVDYPGYHRPQKVVILAQLSGQSAYDILA